MQITAPVAPATAGAYIRNWTKCWRPVNPSVSPSPRDRARLTPNKRKSRVTGVVCRQLVASYFSLDGNSRRAPSAHHFLLESPRRDSPVESGTFASRSRRLAATNSQRQRPCTFKALRNLHCGSKTVNVEGSEKYGKKFAYRKQAQHAFPIRQGDLSLSLRLEFHF